MARLSEAMLVSVLLSGCAATTTPGGPATGARHNSFHDTRTECIAKARELTGGTARIGALDTNAMTSGSHSRGGWSCAYRSGVYQLNVGWYR